MATQVQLRRGNTSQTNAFTGAVAEITIDTDKETIVVHDGSTAGGFPLARESALSTNLTFTQAAFNAANAAGSSATVQAAFDKANSANVLAQAAFDAANTVSPLDSYARTTANTASANTVVIQGVDATQNTNITIATNAATAAFAQANATAGGLTTANSRIDVVEGVNTSQNTNITVIQGVDNTQNTNITIATNAATGAFEQANATAGGLTSANSRITISEGVDVGQNTRMSIIEGVDSTQNTNITNADTKAQAAFNAANTKFSSSGGTITGDTVVTGNLTITGATVYANTENLTVKDNIITLNSNVTGAPSLSAGLEVNRGSSTNTKLLWSEANTAWEFTNDGTTYEKIAGLTYVQAAFDKANSANVLAQAAFDAANTVSPLDSYARTTANAAFTQANTATTLAQAAFNKANTSVDAVLTSTVDTFTGDGSTVAYTLSTTPATINYTTAVIGGVTQPRSAYSVVGTTLTFTSAPANTQIIEVTTIGTSNTTLYTVNNIISPFLLMGA